MTYTLNTLRRVQKELSSLGQDSYIRVRDAIRALAHEPRPMGSKKLTGRSGWRIRVGSYRVIYEIDDVNRVITKLRVKSCFLLFPQTSVYVEANRVTH